MKARGDTPGIIAVDSDGSIYVGLVYQGFPPPDNAHPIVKYRRT